VSWQTDAQDRQVRSGDELSNNRADAQKNISENIYKGLKNLK